MESNTNLRKISEWLKNNFNIQAIDELYLIGSVLNQEFELINDIDIIQKLKENNNEKLIEYSFLIKEIKKKFQIIFNKSLHITTFTSTEKENFDVFISKNNYLKII